MSVFFLPYQYSYFCLPFLVHEVAYSFEKNCLEKNCQNILVHCAVFDSFDEPKISCSAGAEKLKHWCVCCQEQTAADEQAYEDERLQEQFTVLLQDLETYLLPITAELDALFRYRCLSIFECNIFAGVSYIVMLQCTQTLVICSRKDFCPLQ